MDGPGLRRASIADLLAIPEEERYHELIDGEIVQKQAPTFEHGGAQGAMFAKLFGPYGRRAGGKWPGGWWFGTEVDIVLGDEVFRPDIAGWRRDRLAERPKGLPVTAVPDWVCEVLSSNKRNDLIKKKRTYHRFHVSHYWTSTRRRRRWRCIAGARTATSRC